MYVAVVPTFRKPSSGETSYVLCWSGVSSQARGGAWAPSPSSAEPCLDLPGSQLLLLESLFSVVGVAGRDRCFTGEVGLLAGAKPALLAGLLVLLFSKVGVTGRTKFLDGDIALLPSLLEGLLKFLDGELGRVPAALPGCTGRREPGGSGSGLRTPGGRP